MMGPWESSVEFRAFGVICKTSREYSCRRAHSGCAVRSRPDRGSNPVFLLGLFTSGIQALVFATLAGAYLGERIECLLE
jgi:hypothetical protein